MHSIQFEKYWPLKLNNVFAKKQPYVIHAGEGTDAMAHKEIDTLIKINFFKKSLFAVHGVAMDEEQAKNFKGLVWCPDSNFFLLNATADIKRLKTKTTDSFRNRFYINCRLEFMESSSACKKNRTDE